MTEADTSFRASLRRVGVGVREFAWLTDTNPRTVRRWCAGEQDVPFWAGLLLELFARVPDAIEVARDLAAETETEDGGHDAPG